MSAAFPLFGFLDCCARWLHRQWRHSQSCTWRTTMTSDCLCSGNLAREPRVAHWAALRALRECPLLFHKQGWTLSGYRTPHAAISTGYFLVKSTEILHIVTDFDVNFVEALWVVRDDTQHFFFREIRFRSFRREFQSSERLRSTICGIVGSWLVFCKWVQQL